MTTSSRGGLANAALIISKRNPNTVEPGTPIGYWSDEIVKEARRRGCFPILQFMWAEDLEVLAAARGAEIAAQVANDNIAQDPLISAVSDMARAKALETGQVLAPPFLMKMEEYANRCGYSLAYIKKLVPRGLPTLGVHKARRVHVARADKWMEENLDHLDLTDSTDILDLAKTNARKPKKGVK